MKLCSVPAEIRAMLGSGFVSITKNRIKEQNQSRSRKMARAKKYFPLFLMMTPGFLYLIINNYMPMFGLFIAFKSYNFSMGFFKSHGLDCQILNSFLKQRMPGI